MSADEDRTEDLSFDRVLGLHWGRESFWCGVIVEQRDGQLVAGDIDYVFNAHLRVSKIANIKEHKALLENSIAKRDAGRRAPFSTATIASRSAQMQAFERAMERAEDELAQMPAVYFLDVAIKNKVDVIVLEDPVSLPGDEQRDHQSVSQQIRDDCTDEMIDRAHEHGITVLILDAENQESADEQRDDDACLELCQRAFAGEGDVAYIEDEVNA